MSGGSSLRALRAVVDKNAKGFAFLIFDDPKVEDKFLSPQDASHLFHGDRVELLISPTGEVQRLNVLAHRFRELVGQYYPHPSDRNAGMVVYERKRAREEVFIPKKANAKAGDWVHVQLSFHEKGPHPVTGEVIRVMGDEIPASADISMIAGEFNLIEHHTSAAEAEARGLTLEVPGRDLEGRRDLRNLPFITIDGETARDFDDAILVEKTPAGFDLWVAIADVSHYVRAGSALDREARDRGTSVYFPERAFHMLPSALAEDLCSLKPKVPRLALTAKMHFDFNGRKTSTEIFNSVIQTVRRATYNEIEAEFKNPPQNWAYTPHFDLFSILNRARIQRGSIDFDLPEAETVVDESGEPVSIKIRERLTAHRLIEEFMIAANEAVTEWMLNKHRPFIYRVHEEPSFQSLERFQELAATSGIGFNLKDATHSPKILAEFVKKLRDHPAHFLLNMMLLRSMKQAVYQATHGIHYGLASRAYTHFTSPIRRYPDLIVHRLIKATLAAQGSTQLDDTRTRKEIDSELEAIAEHCSYRERLADDASREANRLKQVRIMGRHLGDEFQGMIVGMADRGMFVRISDPYCEGLILGDSLTDDTYTFNEERMIYYGRRKKRTFRLGESVSIRVVRADIKTRQIELQLLSSPSSNKEAPSIGKNKRGKFRRIDRGRGT